MNLEKHESENESILFKVINSPISVIVALILLVISLMIYTRYLVNSVNLYTFYAYDENFSFLSGAIYTGYDINYFGDSKVIYTGEDVKLYDYTMGYYIKDGSTYYEVSTVKGIDDLEEAASLKEIIEKTSFSFTETHKDANFLSKKAVENIDNLVFKISGFEEDKEEYILEIPLEVEKISK